MNGSVAASTWAGQGDIFGQQTTEVDRTTALEVLTVCTGNVVRSPLMERFLRDFLADVPDMVFRSAGTQALIGSSLVDESRLIADAYGVDGADFVARQLDESIVSTSGVVLTATREHKEIVLRMRPSIRRSTFTFLEFARLIKEIPVEASEPGTVAARWVYLAAIADRMRSIARLDRPDDDDLIDPYRAGSKSLWRFEDQFIPALMTILARGDGVR